MPSESATPKSGRLMNVDHFLSFLVLVWSLDDFALSTERRALFLARFAINDSAPSSSRRRRGEHLKS